MKIDHVIYEDGPGGGPKTVLNHLTYYSKVHEVRLLHGGEGMLAKKSDELSVARKVIPLDRLWKAPLGFLMLLVYLLARGPDLLLLHGQWTAFFGAVAGKLAGVPKIVYISQWPSFYTDWDLWRVVRNYVLEAVPCSLCDAVVAISPGNRDEFLRRYPGLGSRLHHISNSIDLSSIPTPKETSLLRKEMGWDDSSCHVLCVGRLASQKRVDWLLDAWQIVERDEARARLWIIGSGELENDLRSQAKKFGLLRCTFLGARPDAWRYIAAADIIAMPSMYEGHANIPLEAMACGKPIVASAVDGVRESFADGLQGFHVTPADSASMAQRLLELIADPEMRRRMGRAGFLHVAKYEKGLLLRKFLDLFEKLGLQQSQPQGLRDESDKGT